MGPSRHVSGREGTAGKSSMMRKGAFSLLGLEMTAEARALHHTKMRDADRLLSARSVSIDRATWDGFRKKFMVAANLSGKRASA
jgi:hypothetical protein